MGTTVKWYVHDADDQKVSMVKAWCDCGEDAVMELAPPWWRRSGDYQSEFSVTIVEPKKWAGKYAVIVESEPVFRARKQ